jgi:hypothetical protein
MVWGDEESSGYFAVSNAKDIMSLILASGDEFEKAPRLVPANDCTTSPGSSKLIGSDICLHTVVVHVSSVPCRDIVDRIIEPYLWKSRKSVLPEPEKYALGSLAGRIDDP